MRSIVLAIALAFVAGPVHADEAPPPQGLGDIDLAILQHLHEVNLLDIAAAKLALELGSEPIQAHAKKLIKDHTRADKTAKRLAKMNGATLVDHPEAVTEIQKAMQAQDKELLVRLASVEGAEFDDVYTAAMIDGHDNEVMYLGAAIEDATNERLKAVLRKLRPVAEKHAQKARDLRASQE